MDDEVEVTHITIGKEEDFILCLMSDGSMVYMSETPRGIEMEIRRLLPQHRGRLTLTVVHREIISGTWVETLEKFRHAPMFWKKKLEPRMMQLYKEKRAYEQTEMAL